MVEKPTESEWQIWGEKGEAAMRNVLGRFGLRAMKLPPGKSVVAVAVAHGVLVSVGGFLRALGGGGNNHVSEQWAMATLRGALRGADGAIHDDGRPFTQASDA